MRILTVASHLDSQGLDNLVKSCQNRGLDIDVIQADWNGFGTKLLTVFNYLIENPDIEDFIFVDAYDVIALGTSKEIEEKIKDREKMLISVEVGAWPDSSLANRYPKTKHKWKYINSGSYYSPSKLFIEMLKNNMPQYSDDDQLYLSLEYLNNPNNKTLDYNCEVFQSYSFIEHDDFEYENGRLKNLKTGSYPSIIHSNGRTENGKLIQMI